MSAIASQITGGDQWFPSQRASNGETVSIDDVIM